MHTAVIFKPLTRLQQPDRLVAREQIEQIAQRLAARRLQFRIAEEDLKLRGEGDVLGTRQSGMPGFHLARIEVHGRLLPAARDDAALVLARDPKLRSPRGEALVNLLYLFARDEAIGLVRAG